MDDFTITTVYFDGQFWCAFIQKSVGGELFCGRHVFGAEPTNPILQEWMLHQLSEVPLYKTEAVQKIRVKDFVKRSDSRNPKSFEKFKEAQKDYFKKKKIENKKKIRDSKGLR